MISHEKLKELLDYDPDTGVFRWRWHRKNAGKIAGTVKKRGHREVVLDGSVYPMHRLAWFYVHGKWPNTIAFDNGDHSDISIANLKNVTAGYSHKNRALTNKNTSGTVGVSLNKNGKWVAKINVSRVAYHLGTFEEKKDAIAARKAAEIQHGFHPDHGRPTKVPVNIEPSECGSYVTFDMVDQINFL